MPRYFTVAEAQAVIPKVAEHLRRAVSLKAELAAAAGEIEAETERVRMAGGALVDHRKLRDAAGRRDAAAARLRETLVAIQENGCQVKDLDMGLLDFPTLLDGEEVCLCWKLGEPEIRFWHGTQEGFRGRKPIDAEFLERHRGGS